MAGVIETSNAVIGTGGVILLAVSVALFVDLLVYERKHFGTFVESWGLTMAAILSLGTLVISLVYSEYFGFVPCGLCWAMRIFVFSQAIILPFAVLRRDHTIAFYGIVLSVPGVILGLYQHYLQMGGGAFLPCPAAGGDCAKRILFEYGFMTFPLLGVSLLLALIAIYLYLLKRPRVI